MNPTRATIRNEVLVAMKIIYDSRLSLLDKPLNPLIYKSKQGEE